MKDNQFLEATVNNVEQIDLINQITDLFFRKRGGIDALLPASSDKHPEVPLFHIYSAIMYFFSFSRKEITNRFPTLIRQLGKLELNEREGLYFLAIKELYLNNFDGAYNYFLQIITQYPGDKLAILMLETIAFISGHYEKLESVYQNLLDDYSEDPDFLGMIAFLYCHQNKKQEAKTFIEKGLVLSPNNAWLQHVYAHALENNSNIKEAISFLESNTEDWKKQSRFFEGHNWMHLCQLYLEYPEKCNTIASIYKEHIWGTAKEYTFEQNNAFLVLWNAELNGVPLESSLWVDLAKHAKHFMQDYFTPYLTITSILAVAKVTYKKAEKAAIDLENYINEELINAPPKYEAWYLGLQVLKGCLAYIRNDTQAACRILESVSLDTKLLGHSDEQRNIFPATYEKIKQLHCVCTY